MPELPNEHIGDDAAPAESASPTAPASSDHRSSSPWVVTAASMVGTTIESYDFFLYGLAAGLVFNEVFFVNDDAALGTVIAFGTFAAGYLMRPIGGIVFGHIGDKLGRKTSLIVTLVMSGVATFLMGLLPTYAAIGVAAPILLIVLRLVQGLGFGGEHGGAVLMAMEHEKPHRRGRAVSCVHMGYPLGVLLAVGVMAAASKISGDAYLDWGWRIPFLLGGVIVVLGYLVRIKVGESPEFSRAQAKRTVKRVPLLWVLRHAPIPVLVGIFVYWCATVTFFYASWVPSYMSGTLNVDRDLTFLIVALASVGALVVNYLAGWAGDRFGRVRTFLVGAVLQGCLSFPAFALIDNKTFATMLAGVALIVLADSTMGPVVMAWVSENFPASVRYTGASLVFQLGAILGSGVSTFIAAWLILKFDTSSAVAAYLLTISVLGILAMLLGMRLRPDPEDREFSPPARSEGSQASVL